MRLVLERPSRSVYDAAANVCTTARHSYTNGLPTLDRAIERLREALAADAEKAHTRNADPETSKEAAAEATMQLTENRRAVMRCFQQEGRLADFQLINRYCGRTQSASGLRTRRAELVKMGLIMWSGNTIKNESGRKVRVWRMTTTED